jgi:hypothetical protein
MGRRLLALTQGGLDGKWWKGAVRPSSQPIQRCMTEQPEVSRGHSTVKGRVPETAGVRTDREGPNDGKSHDVRGRWRK